MRAGFSNLLQPLLLAAIATVASAADIHVGKDAPTIAAAIKAAQPGDTIHLEPKVYHDYAGFYGKKGEPGKPITLDGHGATLDGSEPLKPEQWEDHGDGWFSCSNLLPRLDTAILGRWFFLFDGKMQLMGRTSKGKSAPFKQPADLKPGEWTFVHHQTVAALPKGQVAGTFHIKLMKGQTLQQANIRVPTRSAGVQFSGKNAHLIIKNLTATHPYNDGFNIHGDCRDCVFENIRAIECGDDGISAHESAQYRVKGFVSVGNSTGICDTSTAQTSYEDVFIARCVGFDLYFLDDGRYSLKNALVLSSAQNPFSVSSREKGQTQLNMDNVCLRRMAEPRIGQVAKGAVLTAKHCTFDQLELRLTGGAVWDDCLVNGKPMGGASSRGANAPALEERFAKALKAFAP